MRLVPSNGYIYCFHSHDVEITQRFISFHGVVRSSLLDRFIIIIITTMPIDVEGREVGYPTVYDGYMVRYMLVPSKL